MILEQVILHIKPEQSETFEKAFKIAQDIIITMNGYIGHDLLKCIEEENKYLLLVEWKTIADHEEGFRKSEAYKDWKNLLHHFYDPLPLVQHYTSIL